MLKRYRFLFSQLKILEYQLKQQIGKKSQSVAFKLAKGKRGFVKPDVFRDIKKEKEK